MSSAQKAWIVATGVGVVEALKDQGVLKAAQQHVKTHVGSFSQAKKLSSSAVVSSSTKLKGKQSEESLRTVIHVGSMSQAKKLSSSAMINVDAAVKEKGVGMGAVFGNKDGLVIACATKLGPIISCDPKIWAKECE
ncbi:hypothetical protein RJT34_31200 [Clitoria ternatea]|uniref:Uncharacterized protein n=1 Tax=Clitoria ternatea TaxID=43366 RepID=A0AAN9EU77_CLITE